MAHFMEKRGGYLRNGAVKVLGAKVDLPVLLAAGVPDFIDITSTEKDRKETDGGRSWKQRRDDAVICA